MRVRFHTFVPWHRAHNRPKAAFYAVAVGRTPGIYTTWSEAEQQVKGFAGARFKKFNREADALKFSKDISGPLASRPGASAAVASSKSKAAIPKIEASGLTRRASSPPLHASISELPPDLQALSQKGWRFSKRQPTSLVVYTDGSGIGNGKAGAKAGLGVWWGDSGEAAASNLSERVPGRLQTNNRGELLSVIRALETCPHELPLEIRTDSQYTIKCVTEWLPGWVRNGYRTSGAGKNGKQEPIKNADMIKHMMVLLHRPAGVRFKYVPGHSGLQGNEGADLLARMGAAKPPLPDRTHWLDPDDPQSSVAQAGKLPDIKVEIDEDCFMTPKELAELEAELV